jgi:mono/diheme cytochrome c family protein
MTNQVLTALLLVGVGCGSGAVPYPGLDAVYEIAPAPTSAPPVAKTSDFATPAANATPAAETMKACSAPLDDATWSTLYATYFAANTPGHCGDCHGATPKGGLLVGDTKESFLAGLVARGLIDAEHPAQSSLLDPATSPLRWFSESGPMPRDNPVPNPDAASDIRQWLTSAKRSSCAHASAPPMRAPPSKVGTCATVFDGPEWNAIFAAYFAPNTDGHCGDCHGARANGGFLVGSTARSFLDGLLHKGLLDPANPAKSMLIDPQASPVSWFNPNGPMPRDSPGPNPQAASDIEIWITSVSPRTCSPSPQIGDQDTDTGDSRHGGREAP